MSGDELDRERMEAIAQPILEAIRANYLRGPPGRDRVYEALNVLAACAATVIAGTQDRDGRRQSRAFFDKALDQNVADMVRNPPVARR